MVNFWEFLYKLIYYTSNYNKDSASLLPTILSLAAIFLTVINSLFTIISFFYKDIKENKSRNQSIKLDFYKSLILNSNFPLLNDFFEKIEAEANKLKSVGDSVTSKEKINEFIINQRNVLKKKFIDLLQIADINLQKKVLESIDNLIDFLTEKIFSDTDFTDTEAYEKLVTNMISETKRETLNILYNYKG